MSFTNLAVLRLLLFFLCASAIRGGEPALKPLFNLNNLSILGTPISDWTDRATFLAALQQANVAVDSQFRDYEEKRGDVKITFIYPVDTMVGRNLRVSWTVEKNGIWALVFETTENGGVMAFGTDKPIATLTDLKSWLQKQGITPTIAKGITHTIEGQEENDKIIVTWISGRWRIEATTLKSGTLMTLCMSKLEK
jgi:hypothetical protein